MLNKTVEDLGGKALDLYRHMRSRSECDLRYRFSFKSLRGVKKSDTIFVLGSSESINDLTDEQWGEVRGCDSFALNCFCFHSHMPTFYWLELHDNLAASHYVLKEISEKYSKEKTNFIMNYNAFKGASIRFDSLPGALTSNFSFVLPRMYRKSSDSVVRAELKRIRAAHRKNRIMYDSFAHIRGSLLPVLQICWSMGYRKIVLLGVDLLNTRYFFDSYCGENVVRMNEILGLQERYEGRYLGGIKHRTVREDLNSKSPPMDKIVRLLYEELCCPDGVEVYVQSNGSLLASFLPVFQWRTGTV